MRRIFGWLFGALFVLIAVLAFKTWQYKPEVQSEATAFDLGADLERATGALSQAIRFETISQGDHQAAFDGFLAFLQSQFPKFHATTERTELANNTVLYKWAGSDPALAPVLLAAHSDVVPIAFGSLDRWSYTPFSGEVADGYVWGRGTLDNKGALIAILAAAEHVAATGFAPQRTVYFSFGGDEEVGGKGAKSVADHLIKSGVRLAWSLDEGSFVLDDVIPGLDVPVASINLSEKGYLTVTLIAEAAGGHSALPPRITAVGRIARAVDRLQSTLMPGGLDGVSAEFFDKLGRYFSLEKRVLFANQWLFSPVLEEVLSGAATTNAMLRTTTAPTMLSGSNKENVLAARATAKINFRLHPRDSIDDVIAHVRETIDDDQVVIEVNRDFASEASPVAPTDTEGFRQIEQAIYSTFGPLASVPGLTIAATDSRHYAQVADAAYRINPFIVKNDDIARFHGIDERLSIENLNHGINFFGKLLLDQ
ncbi:hypothetical protein DS909_03605 [Phaeobacter gallaeciensis]|uniref:Peptidase M20 dimerisation domain-containing protein n=2 Tax=Roseobacteraceae TaxID=2854170 RepID=A0A366XBQ9_9RHOB|nr:MULTISPECIES: M20 family peptidase [Roseobacteraceae]MBT3142486.1 M20 family peptidase [Falsiruegeria litorea]MBT8169286.1 M20 family peptidase [Falsiruegeria litorea]RBW60522.1 hypothetical protein DS909_03605 [Phaeobacter gallaeciensis]